MTVPDAQQNNTFDANFHSLIVRGATWVEYWLQLDSTPHFDVNCFAPSAQIQDEIRCLGGAAVAARALWKWGWAARLETAFGDDANAKFARRTVENDLQEMAGHSKSSASPPKNLKVENLSERAQPYRVHLCAPQNEMKHRALLQHGFCDETLHIQWQHDNRERCVAWREQQLWLDDQRLNLQSTALRNVAGGVQVLAAVICRAVIENRSWDALEKEACKYLQGKISTD